MRREKGSITLFSMISLLLITAAVFALLEGTRLQEMRRFAKLQTESALESAFAEYKSCLWQTYRLLGTNRSKVQEMIKESADVRAEEGVNLLRLVPEEVELEEYALLTDAEGAVFAKSVATYMKENWVYEAAKELYSQYEAVKHLLDTSQMDDANIEEALEEIEQIEISEGISSVGSSKTNQEGGSDWVAEILEAAKRWREMGILELVIADTEQVSKASLDTENGLLDRNLEKGTIVADISVGWDEKMLLQQYLLTYLSSFQNVQEGRALSYELEFLIGEKASDIDNLKAVATRILGIREAANFLYLLSNTARVAQAEAMATLLVGTSMNPVLIEVVKLGLLTAWALAESILDVRALLAGKRIALLKSEETWTTELQNISMIVSDFTMAKESSSGLRYENYLGILLLLENEKKIAMRTMHVQEATVRMSEQDDSFCMDSLLIQAQVKMSYSYKPVFPFLRVINAQERWENRVWARTSYGYY